MTATRRMIEFPHCIKSLRPRAIGIRGAAPIENRMNTESLSTPPGPVSELLPDAAPAARVEMIFRLWAPAKDPESRGPGQRAAQHAGVLALIEDIVASKRGVFHATDDPLFVSGLTRPTDALVIARQIQLGIQGFRGRTGAYPVAVSIAIDAGANGASTAQAEKSAEDRVANPGGASSVPSGKAPEPSHDLLTLLKLARPAQILVTHDAWQRVANLKGLPLKSFPGRFGVYEYLWTAEEKLDLIQSEPQLTLAVLPAALPTPSGSTPAKDMPTPAIPAASAPETPEAEAPKTSTEDDESAVFRLPRPAWVAGLSVAAAGVIALAALGIGHVFSSRAAKSNPPTSIQQPSQSPAATPNPPGNSTATPAPPAASPASSRKTPAASQAKTAKPKPCKPAVAVQENPAPPPAPSPQCTFAGDTARLATLAEQYRERGNYANAERIFRQVLACDPSNAAAREGLNRTLEGEQQARP
jgi:hypothetical protein